LTRGATIASQAQLVENRLVHRIGAGSRQRMSPDPLVQTIAAAQGRHLRMFTAEIHLLAGELSDDEFWTRPYPYGNTFGHLVLHLTGNLNYYIGAQMAGTGYVRDREREFMDPSRVAKQRVLDALDEAVAMAVKTIEAQSAEDWSRDYAAVRTDETNRFGMVLRCAEHFHHHVGQMIYLVKEHARRRLLP
jgi:hypothetical protein